MELENTAFGNVLIASHALHSSCEYCKSFDSKVSWMVLDDALVVEGGADAHADDDIALDFGGHDGRTLDSQE